MPSNLEDPKPRRWTRWEYDRAAEMGLFRPEERLELIEGEILTKVTPQNTPHVTGVILCTEALRNLFGIGYVIRTQMPIVLNDGSEPEPDVLVVPGGPRDYEDHHPTPSEVLLLIEVSDTTLEFDRGRKARLYAAAGIREYWLLNLPERKLEIHRQPRPDGSWGSVTVPDESSLAAPLEAPNASIRISDLLPRAKLAVPPR